MRDPFYWSLPIGRLFGILVRVHILFPLVAIGLILRATYHEKAVAGIWIDALMVEAILFFSVLLHELGHCMGARLVDGEANEILLWPLGGLASIDVPHTPRANFIATAAGPAVNLLLCLLTGMGFLLLTQFEYRPPWNPFWHPYYVNVHGLIEVFPWNGSEPSQPIDSIWVIILARTFWLNWVLFLFNVLLPAFPLDGGRLLQSALWPRFGYRDATMISVYAGFGVALILGVVCIVNGSNLTMFLALFIYVNCQKQLFILENGGEESLFGYDFTQGYTSLERGEPTLPRRKKPNFIQRWLQRRAARKLQREQEQRESEERRLDELLEKVQREGKQSLTDEESRFLKRVSDRYRHR